MFGRRLRVSGSPVAVCVDELVAVALGPAVGLVLECIGRDARAPEADQRPRSTHPSLVLVPRVAVFLYLMFP